jgi:hypothetical protein
MSVLPNVAEHACCGTGAGGTSVSFAIAACAAARIGLGNATCDKPQARRIKVNRQDDEQCADDILPRNESKDRSESTDDPA